MPELGNPQPLDYRGPPKGRRRYVESPEEKRWRWIRILFRVVLVVFVFFSVDYLAGNYFLTGQITAIKPADFVPYVKQFGVPLVLAVKQQNRETGKMPIGPSWADGLLPKYLPANDNENWVVYSDRFMMLHAGHRVTYDLTPGAEHWEVSGAVANGIIPVPPVVLPATQPAPHP